MVQDKCLNQVNFFTRSVSLYHRKPQNQRNPWTPEQKLKTIAVLPDAVSVLVKPHHLTLPLAEVLGESPALLSWILCGHLNNYQIFYGFLPILLSDHGWCLSTPASSQTVDVNATSPHCLSSVTPFSRCRFTFIGAYSTVSSHLLISCWEITVGAVLLFPPWKTPLLL